MSRGTRRPGPPLPGGRQTRRPSRSAAPGYNISDTLGSLLRTTLQQVGAVREAALQTARSSRMRLDAVMLERKRRDALARVGEVFYEMAAEGHFGDLADYPELAGLLADVDAIEREFHEIGEEPAYQPEVEPAYGDEDPAAGSDEPGRGRGNPRAEAVSSAGWTPPPRRAQEQPMRVWRPVVPPDLEDRHDPHTPHDPHAPHGAQDPDDRSDLQGQEAARQEQAPAQHRDRPDASRRMRRPRDVEAAAREAPARGGITFVPSGGPGYEDEDLSEYMHEDDLPARK